jgi:hypothetical protein
MSRTRVFHPARLRRLLPAALFAAAVALASSTLGYPAIANAVWDVEKYDRCVADLVEPGADIAVQITIERYCCEQSGGLWNGNQVACQAPPAQGAGTDTSPPPKAGIPTVPVQPPIVGIG